MKLFNNKTLLITGGTGSFGKAILSRLIDTNIAEIRIFSRDEKKQDEIRKNYTNNKIKFYIGDIRDHQSILNAMYDVDYVFHAAALKQVPSCEFHPLEAIKTNILGTEYTIQAAIESKVQKVVCLSTDKAVYPINVMGISKAMMEKVMVAKSRNSNKTIICATRYGNVMASRGSVIPYFTNQIRNKIDITITDPKMTRFMMTLDEAVDLVLYAFSEGAPGDIFVQKSPAVSIETLAKAIKEVLKVPEHPTKIIGTRHGEKLFEVLLSREEMASAVDLGRYYKIPPDLRDLNYEKYIEQGQVKISEAIEYSSHNTDQLDIKSMKQMLMKLKFIETLTNGYYIEPEE